MTGLPPAALIPAVQVQEKHWWDPWVARRRATCDGCAEVDRVMVVDEGVHLCSACHRTNLELWRKEDEEDERRELLMDELFFLNSPSLDDRYNAREATCEEVGGDA